MCVQQKRAGTQCLTTVQGPQVHRCLMVYLASKSKTEGTQTSWCRHLALTFHALGLMALGR